MDIKVALCISGGMRNYMDTYDFYKKHIVDVLDCDIFIYGLENKDGKYKNSKDLIDLYKPKGIIINDEKYYEDMCIPYKKENLVYSFYNVFECNNLKKEYEINNGFIYDRVIRCRPDYFPFRKFTENEIFFSGENIIIPREWAFKQISYFAVSDIFAFGKSESLDKYSETFLNIKKYLNEDVKYHAESLMGYHLTSNTIPYLEYPRSIVFEYPSLRTEKYIYPYKFFKYFEEPNIIDEIEFCKIVSGKRKQF